MQWVSLLPVAMIVWGAISMVQARREARLAATSRHWPRAAGSVTASAVKVVPVQGGDPVFDLELAYRYAVAGQELEGHRLRFGMVPRSGVREEIEALVQRYPAGAAVQVAYNPGAPREAVLEPGAMQDAQGRGGMGIYLVGLGLGLWLLLQLLAR